MPLVANPSFALPSAENPSTGGIPRDCGSMVQLHQNHLRETHRCMILLFSMTFVSCTHRSASAPAFQVAAIENDLDLGQIEQVIEMCKSELQVIDMYYGTVAVFSFISKPLF